MYSWGSMSYLRASATASPSDSIDGRNEKVAAELDHVGHLGFGADDERALTDGIEDRLAALEDSGVSGSGDKELTGRSGLRAAEDRCGDVVLPVFVMVGGQSLRQGHADGAHRDVDRAGRKGFRDASSTEDGRTHGSIVSQHCDRDFGLAGGVSDGLGHLGLVGAKLIGLG